MHYMVGHCRVDFASKLDESRAVLELSGFPCKVKWIDGNAVSTQPRAWVKCHEAKRLRFRRCNYLPDVNPHGSIDKFQLVDQGNIDTPEDVLEELRRLSNAAARNRHDRLDCAGIEFHRFLETHWRQPSDQLRHFADLTIRDRKSVV